MHEAFDVSPVLEWKKLPFEIKSIEASGSRLYVGTSGGQLLVYEVPTEKQEGRYTVELKDSKKNLTANKRPITQLSVVEEFNLLLSLSDGVLYIHDLTTLAPSGRGKLEDRGITLFAFDVQLAGGLTADTHWMSEDRRSARPTDLVLRLCVVVKKRIITYRWRSGSFQEREEMQLSDAPKCVAWCGRSLCVGFKKEYNLIDERGSPSEVFKTGRDQEPSMARIPGNELLLGKDQISIFVGVTKQCKPTRTYGIRWSSVPSVVDVCAPYVVALLSDKVEVRTMDTVALVQEVALPKARLITQGDYLYVASPNTCWRLELVKLELQIEELLRLGEFEDALNLAELVKEPREKKATRMFGIKQSFAYSQFAKKHFDQALKTFSELDIDPPRVIGLYPNLLPEAVRASFKYPIDIPTMNDSELQTAFKALIAYLTQKRNDLNKLPESGEDGVNRARRELSEIIDTTLLKAYLETNPSLVGPLLRVQNSCNVTESEKMLTQAQMYSELVMLYKNRGEHRKALELLREHAKRPTGSMKGHFQTLMYLQRLGGDYADLVFEFSPLVIKADLDDAFSIFASDDYPEIATLPREKVLKFLQSSCSALVARYLEFVIFKWGCKIPDFHNQLVLRYLEDVAKPMAKYLQTITGLPAKPGEEPSPLGPNRKKLLKFLEESQWYEPSKMLSRFIDVGDLLEERAILYGRIGRHDQALSIYAHRLSDVEKAEDYCNRHYSSDRGDAKDIYLHLLQIYLKPSDGFRRNLPAAIAALSKYYQRINTKKALDLLPDTTKLSEVREFLVAVMRERGRKSRDIQVLKNLHKAERLQTNEELLMYQGRRTTMTEDKLCFVCGRTIRSSAFARYPNGIVVHYYCCKDKSVCPCTNPKCVLQHQPPAVQDISEA